MIDIYTPEFEYLATISHPQSVKWHLKYSDVGNCEIYLDTNDKSIGLFVEHDDLIVVQGRYSAWVSGCADDLNGFLISGRTLNWLLSNREVLPFTKDDTAENIIRAKMTEQFMTEGVKNIPNFFLSDTIGGTKQTEYILEEYSRSLLEIVRQLCNEEKIGFEVIFDYFKNKYVFNLYRGIDRSSNQSVNLPLIMSEINRNFLQTQYLKNNNDYRNIGYLREVDEQGDVFFTEIIKDNASGFYRREIGMMDEIALSEKERIIEIEGSIYGLKYHADFDLGDIVTLQKQVGGKTITQNRRITEIIINQEVGNNSVLPILGEV